MTELENYILKDIQKDFKLMSRFKTNRKIDNYVNYYAEFKSIPQIRTMIEGKELETKLFLIDTFKIYESVIDINNNSFKKDFDDFWTKDLLKALEER